MKLPWNNQEKQEKIEELEESIEELEEERDRYEKRFEAEKERRSGLARKKQEAEEELNRLKDKVESLKDANGEEEDKRAGRDIARLSFREGYRLLEKLDSVKSSRRDMVTVFSPGEISEVEDLKGLKNTLNLEQVQRLQATSSFVAFMDPDMSDLVLKTLPFLDAKWTLSDGFEVEPLLDFIDSEKTWVLVSAGETEIYREQSGEYEEVDRVKSRVDRQHGKGGFSQDRFERKREGQIKQHLGEVEEALAGMEKVYLLGDRKLCKELPGEYLGGFDPNSSPPEVFYSFQRVR